MTQAQLVETIALETGLMKNKAAIFVEGLKSVLTQQLEQGEAVTLVNFGTFSVKEREERQGYNFKTKERVKIPATRLVCFKPADALKDAVRDRDAAESDGGV